MVTSLSSSWVSITSASIALSASLAAAGGEAFRMECALDRAGGDMGMQYTFSMEACINLCGMTSGCIVVS